MFSKTFQNATVFAIISVYNKIINGIKRTGDQRRLCVYNIIIQLENDEIDRNYNETAAVAQLEVIIIIIIKVDI